MDCICLSFSPLISFPPKLTHGAKLCKQNKLGHFPIHAAAFVGAQKALEVILDIGMRKRETSQTEKPGEDENVSPSRRLGATSILIEHVIEIEFVSAPFQTFN